MLGDLKQMNESLLEVGKGLAVELKHVCKELKRYNDRTDNE